MAAKQMLRVGLVGAGQICEFHIRALNRLPHASIVGVADSDWGRAAAVQARWNLPGTYSSLDALCDSGVDVIHVLTPPATHAALTLRALERGCHVYVEKPLATSVEDCDRIAQEAKRQDKSVCVGHSLLRDPFVLRALRLVRSGAIGDPLTVDYFRCASYPPYAGGPLPVPYREGGYPFRDLGIHALYIIVAFLGEIVELNDLFWSSGREPHLHFDEWRVLLKCERGNGQVQLSWNVRPQQNLLVVQGTRGIIRADLFGMSVTLKRQRRLPEHANRVLNSFSEARQAVTQTGLNALKVVSGRLRQYHGLQALIADFYQSLADDRPAPVTPDQARSATCWTEAIARRADAAKADLHRRFSSPLRNRVLVTGASGFIGRNLVARLLDEQQSVRLLVRREPAPELVSHPQVEIELGDLGDPDAVERAVAGVDTIYHVGAAMRGTKHDFDRGTIVGTRNVVDAALRHAVGKLIYISSLSVLQSLPGGASYTEASPIEMYPELRGHYSRAKTAAEQYVTNAVKSHGLRAIILRPGEVVGAGAPLLTSGIAQRRGGRLIVLGDGSLRVPMVYIDDLLDAIWLAERSNAYKGSVFHIVDPISLTQNELLGQYLAATSEQLRIIHIPRPVVFALAGMVQVLARSLRRPAPISIYRIRSALAPRSFDCRAAEVDLGWLPKVGVMAGLRIALESELASHYGARNSMATRSVQTSSCHSSEETAMVCYPATNGSR